ncbi:protein of unknown function [Candidatus Nitrosotalea okcheonensis]|uniref:Uncharacterized protein n=1 Tax=Candidatus Nitrosotalea okcheonensis TaxID=1903276 RepID=A0A2H1FDB4_9ARCH|nr:protein of unknown function [Candidatus Nitrosotalea okcheonensis]
MFMILLGHYGYVYIVGHLESLQIMMNTYHIIILIVRKIWTMMTGVTGRMDDMIIDMMV